MKLSYMYIWSNPPVVATALTCLIASELGHDCGSCVCVCVCTLIGLLRWYALERVSGEIHLIMSPVKPRQPYMYMYTYYMHMIYVHAHVNLSVCTMYIIPRVQHKQECTPIQFGRGINEFHMELWPVRCIFLVVVDTSYWGASEGLNGHQWSH